MTKSWRSSCCRSASSTGRWCGTSLGAATAVRGWSICPGLSRSVPKQGKAPGPATTRPCRRAGARSRSGGPTWNGSGMTRRGSSSSCSSSPPRHRDLLLRDSPRFQTWGVFELLVERSLEVSIQDPAFGEHLGLPGAPSRRSPGPHPLRRGADRGPAGARLGFRRQRLPAAVRPSRSGGSLRPRLSTTEEGNTGWPGAGDLPGSEGVLAERPAALRRILAAPPPGGGPFPQPWRAAPCGPVAGEALNDLQLYGTLRGLRTGS